MTCDHYGDSLWRYKWIAKKWALPPWWTSSSCASCPWSRWRCFSLDAPPFSHDFFLSWCYMPQIWNLILRLGLLSVCLESISIFLLAPRALVCWETSSMVIIYKSSLTFKTLGTNGWPTRWKRSSDVCFIGSFFL